MTYSVHQIDHVNIQIPVGGEAEAEHFWMGILGFGNRPKPDRLAAQGGRWFVQDKFEIHVSPNASFQPSSESHIAMRVNGLEELVQVLDSQGFHPVPTSGFAEGETRYFVNDPFGNRLELISS